MSELKEMAIFLTHYLGFPLGSKLDGVVTKVAKQRKKAAEKGQGEDKKGNVNAAREDASGRSLDDKSRYAALSREQLATLVPELLLIGQLIDRSGMALGIAEFGREEMLQVAIEEWKVASPIYTNRMRKALSTRASTSSRIFKGLQLDIGAPPQFMDFRYTVHDHWHGEFYLDHCGALARRRADG